MVWKAGDGCMKVRREKETNNLKEVTLMAGRRSRDLH